MGALKRHNPIGVAAYLEFETQGSRGGNPGLEVITASRYVGGTDLIGTATTAIQWAKTSAFLRSLLAPNG